MITLVVLAAVVALGVVVWGGGSEPSGCDDYADLIERIDAGGQEGQSEGTLSDLEAIAVTSEDSADVEVSEAATALAADMAAFRRDGNSITLPGSISGLAEACGLDPASVFRPPGV